MAQVTWCNVIVPFTKPYELGPNYGHFDRPSAGRTVCPPPSYN